ncbi:MAG TPA: BTAD domain-containing putative transcriptional regulator [Marmoricola sp.]|nr:BTAD domain-containing putative transcriptional regulator [Marmoricola sp.]
MWVGVLGPTVVRDSGTDPDRTVTLKAAKHRALLAALALSPGVPVPADRLVEALWGDAAPPSALATLHTYLSVVRRTLEPALTPRAPSRYLARSDLGYQLLIDPGALDVEVFVRTAAEVHAAMGSMVTETAPLAEDPAGAAVLLQRLDAALGLWRGEPYADVVGEHLVVAERNRLAEIRALAEEDRATLLIAAGDAASAVGELEALAARHPLRERLWVLLAVALSRTGRQAEALSALDRLRILLDEELALEPSAVVRELQTAILRQEKGVAHAPVELPRQRTPPVPVQARSVPFDVVLPDWPLVGREDDLLTLTSLLDAADLGTLSFAAVVGEPGAGKSRLAMELSLRAATTGARVLLGRCSPDEDAPPLWPWTMALAEALSPVPAGSSGDHDAERFAVADGICRDLLRLAGHETVVLVLEDLHWADPSSLRVLRHLCNQTATARLLVVCTWRRGAEADALGEAAEALGRRHATHVELAGLDPADAADVLAAVSGAPVDGATTRSALARTEGNPFFLIEYARLARDEGRPLGSVLASTPRTVADVVRRRIRQLPEGCTPVLTAAAVIGRRFELPLLAATLDLEETAVLDLLEPAIAVDLVQDLGADVFRFVHALVRDAAYDELGPSRRERMHARVAELVAGTADAPQRAAEIARHWAAAGKRQVRNAWQSAAGAGAVALEWHGAEEAAEHYAAALALQSEDRTATARERFDVLLGYADACRWSTRMVEMTEAADEAILLAEGLDRPDLLVRATTVETAGAVWPVRVYGAVNADVVAAMRSTLAALPRDDSELRCRLLLALAGELYYAGAERELDALVEEGVAMARRLGEPALLLDMLQAAAVARWRRSVIEDRLADAQEATDLAHAIDDEQAYLVSRFLAATARCALGRVDGLGEELGAIIAESRANRMYFVEMAALGLDTSWASMTGDVARVDANAARLGELDDVISLAHKADGLVGALLVPAFWLDRDPAPARVEEYLEKAHVPVEPGYVVLLLRKDQADMAREVWAGTSYDVARDNWYSEMNWALGAEIALGLGDRELAAQVYERLLPLQGGCIISGTGPAHGPVHAYLALAAAAVGESTLARGHADVAAGQCAAWGLPQVAQWLDDLRERHAF